MQAVSINDRIESIKHDESEINRFVEEYKPFIAACVEKTVGRYVHYGEDDELSIALMAFVEAIKAYNPDKGNFLPFSQNVIKRRLIDYYRKEKKHSTVLSLNTFMPGDEEEGLDLSIDQAIGKYTDEEISEYRRMELEEFKRELEKWDISFMDLVDVSPKHGGTRKIYGDIIKYLLSQPELVCHIKQKKYLPVAEIEKNTRIHRKKIERARKYIIAVLIVMTGDYKYIEEYINWG